MSTQFHVRNGLVSHGDVNLLGNKLTTTTPNGNILIVPNGTGRVGLSGMMFPANAGTAGQVLVTDGSGNLTWGSVAAPSVSLDNLNDVVITGATNGQALVFNGTSWVNGPVTPTFTTQAPATVLAGPTSGADGAPTFRNLVASDIPSLDAAKINTGTFDANRIPSLDAAKITSGTFSSAQIPSLDASKITTGTLSVSRGGTGVTTLTTNGIVIGNGTGAVNQIAAPSTSNTYLMWNGTSFAWSAVSAGSGGTVTSVSLSMPTEFSVTPASITTSGTFTVTKANQTANLVYAGPSNGAAAAPTFRSLVAADIPSLDAAKITTGTLASARLGSGTADSSTYLRGDGTWATVTATFNPGTQTANTVYAGPSTGAAANPTWRSLVAADIPNLDTSKLTSGTLGLTRGGTGADLSALVSNQILYKNGSAVAGMTAPSTANTYLKWNGTGFEWASVTAGSTTVTVNSTSGISTIAFTGAGVTTSFSGSTATVNIPGGGTSGGMTRYRFRVDFQANSGSNPSLVSESPAGWNFTIAGTTITVTHNLGTAPLNMIVLGYNTSNKYNFRTFSSGLNINFNAMTDNSFDIVGLTNTASAAASGGHAYIDIYM